MANMLKIKELIKEKRLTIREVAMRVGITEQGLQKLIRENSTKVETLEAISKVLQVPISTFFDIQDSTSSIDSLTKSQQRTIENLSETIKNLTSKE